MRATSLWRLVRLWVARDFREAVFAGFGVVVGVGALVFFVGLGLGVARVIREKVFPTDARLVDVVPASLSVGGLWGSGTVDQRAADRLSALSEVAAVFRKMEVRVPGLAHYEGSFFGSPLNLALEVLAVGVDEGLLGKDVRLGAFRDGGDRQPVPAVVSSRLLAIYNGSFAPSRKLPRVSAAMLAGFTFPVEFNRSMVSAAPRGPALPVQIRVAGVSDRALLLGVTVPLSSAVRINRAAGADAESFSALTVQAKDPSGVPRIVEEVKRMGLRVDDQERRLAQSAGAAVAIATSALALLATLICLLGAVNIAHALSAQVRSREREIGLMRAVGASRGDIRSWVLAEAAVVGAFGGALGTGLALLAAGGVDRLAQSRLPAFFFQPQSFFWFPLWVPALGLAVGLLAALGGAYWPSRRAARLDPAQVLSG